SRRNSGVSRAESKTHIRRGGSLCIKRRRIKNRLVTSVVWTSPCDRGCGSSEDDRTRFPRNPGSDGQSGRCDVGISLRHNNASLLCNVRYSPYGAIRNNRGGYGRCHGKESEIWNKECKSNVPETGNRRGSAQITSRIDAAEIVRLLRKRRRRSMPPRRQCDER